MSMYKCLIIKLGWLTYDRFGNFIGEVEESEDDSQHGIDAGAYVYDEYPEEEAVEATGQELMEIDGSWSIERNNNMTCI
jgi:hypothetical protein